MFKNTGYLCNESRGSIKEKMENQLGISYNMSFFSCGTCGKLTCWDGATKTVKCGHCGKVSDIEGTISTLSTGEDI